MQSRFKISSFLFFIHKKLYLYSMNEGYIGDLEEQYCLLRTKGKWKALHWLFVQFARSVPSLIFSYFLWSLTMFKNHVILALRNIRKYKIYSFVNIVGLAVGMACCILILLWVQDELSYDQFHKNGKRIYMLTLITDRGTWRSSPWALVPTLKNDFPEVEMGSQCAVRTVLVRHGDRMFYETGAMVVPEFLKIFTFPFKSGDPTKALDNIESVVITESTAHKYFGSEDPIGKTLTFENSIDLVVTGVMEDIPSNSHLQFALMARPEVAFGKERMKTWSADCPSYILLAEGANPTEFENKIRDTINKYDKRTTVKYYVGMHPLQKIHLYALQGTNPVVYVILFAGVAVIVLLIACINFMNLATARSSTRAREVGLRKVVGAARPDLIRQFFGESIILSIMAVVIGLGLVYLYLPSFNSMAAKSLEFKSLGNNTNIIGILLMGLFTGIIAGIYPALILSSFQPVKILRHVFVKRSKGVGLRKTLIVFQFTAAILLIIMTSVLFKQMQYIRNKDLGFNKEQIITVRMNRQMRQKYETMKPILRQHENISHVTAASNIPLRISNNNPFYWEGGSADEYISMSFACVDYDYFETFNMEMVHGRPFSKKFPTDRGNYIINEAALKMTGYEDPVGRMFSMWTTEGEIVGVVKDFHATTLHNSIKPIVFLLYKNLPYFIMFIKIAPNQIGQTLDHIENVIETHVPGIPFQYEFLDEIFDRQYQQEARLLSILEAFAGLAIFVSCLGLLGLASFMAEQKTKEIAIRKVLGASPATIVGNMSKEFLWLVLAANGVAWPVGFYLSRAWMENFVFKTSIGIWPYFISAALAVIVALITVSFQSIRAAHANPVDSMRTE